MTMTSEQDTYHVLDRVAFGASILDEVWPGWTDKIDLDRLDMRDGKYCVGGQLIRASSFFEGSFYYEFERAFANLVGISCWSEYPYPVAFFDACGFNIIDQYTHADVVEEYKSLERAWIEEVQRRRGRPLENLNDVIATLHKARGYLMRVDHDPVVSRELMTHLRDTASALLTTIGRMQTDLDRNGKG